MQRLTRGIKMYDDFTNEELVDLSIDGYEKGDWKYKPATGGEELDWTNEYISIDKDGKNDTRSW